MREGRLAPLRPQVPLTDRIRLARRLHLGEPEPGPAPREPRVTDLVVDDGECILPIGRVHVLGPQRAGLDQVLVGIDDGHGIPLDAAQGRPAARSGVGRVRVRRRPGTEGAFMCPAFEKCVMQSVTGFAITGDLDADHLGVSSCPQGRGRQIIGGSTR